MSFTKMASVSCVRQAHGPMLASEHARPTEVARTSRAGSARLAFERVGNRTMVRTALAHSPLRLLTPRNHGHAAWVYIYRSPRGCRSELSARVAPGALLAWVPDPTRRRP